MKPLRLLRWSGTVLSPRARPSILTRPCYTQLPLSAHYPLRSQSTSAAIFEEQSDDTSEEPSPSLPRRQYQSTPSELLSLPSPPPSRARKSAKLAALHARLSLSPRLPFETLARCLVDSTADPDPRFNNTSLSLLGSSLLAFYTSEAILGKFPRLPMEVVFATMWAYSGPKTLGLLTREWGVEVAAEPGGEVDPGYLQCRRLETRDSTENPWGPDVKNVGTVRPNAQKGWRIGTSSKSVYDNQFGDEVKKSIKSNGEAEDGERGGIHENQIPLEEACANFVNALVGAVYLHLGRRAAKAFFNEHIHARFLDVGKMFSFQNPSRDLQRLLAREGFDPATARIKSETGRKSRSPVFVVGVYTGNEELAEGTGSSLDEARTRAAIMALKTWYLYSPLEVRVPSDAEERGSKWEPVLIDGGEVIV